MGIKEDSMLSELGNAVSMITITDVKISPDLSFAKVFVSVLNEEKAVEAIAHHAGDQRGHHAVNLSRQADKARLKIESF